MAETLNYSINVGGNAGETIGSIKKQLREANAELIKSQETFGNYSKEARLAGQRVAELKDRIKEAKEFSDLFDPGKKFQVFANTLNTVAGGFAAVQGAIGLFGAESKELEKQLLKVQSAIALSQGLSVIADGAKDFQRLASEVRNSTIFIKANDLATKAAAATTKLFGVAVDTTATSFKVLKGAIAATGIGLLVVAIGFLIEKLSTLSSSSEEAAEKQKKLNEELANTTKAAVAAAEKFIDSDTKLKIARAKLAGASEKELLQIEQDGIKAKIAARQRSYEDLLKTDRKAASQLAEQNADAQDQLALNELNFEIAQRDKINAIKLQKDKEYRDLQKKQLEEYNERIYIQGLINLERRNQEAITTVETEARTVRDQNAIVATQVVGNTKVVLNEETLKKLDNAQSIYDENEKRKSQVRFNNEVALAGQTLDVIGGLIDKNSIAGKGIAVAQAIINTYQGATKAFAQGGILGPVLGAATIAAGLINVQKIISTPIPSAKGTGSVGGSVSAAATRSSASPIQPPTEPQIATTNISQASINALGNQSVKAYVVESDISSSQQRIAAIQQRARFE